MLFSIIIPLYKPPQSVAKLCMNISEFFSPNYADQFEIIIIVDDPKLRDFDLVNETKKNLHTRVFLLNDNYGQHIASLFGASMALGKYIITLDQDWENVNEHLIFLQNHFQQNDLIYLTRQYNKLSINQLFRLVSMLLGYSAASSFRCFSASLLNKKNLYKTTDYSLQNRANSILTKNIEWNNSKHLNYTLSKKMNLLIHTLILLPLKTVMKICLAYALILLLLTYCFPYYCFLLLISFVLPIMVLYFYKLFYQVRITKIAEKINYSEL